MDAPIPEEVGGYVLAGGRSVRMGRDKALIELAGKPLLRHAVKKLRRVCMDVRVLGDKAEFERFAPLVPDLHPGCGPIGGMEAALTHSIFDWNLFLPVDMPFLPSALLDHWVRRTLEDERRGARVAMFTVDGVPQPTLVLLHREVLPFLSQAIERARYKVYPVLTGAGEALAERQEGNLLGMVLRNLSWGQDSTFSRAVNRYGGCQEAWLATTEAQQAAKHLWFANLNTPEAEQFAGALDT
jgi:molybdopterin-guanine dinucleotide biosynthesis protein A